MGSQATEQKTINYGILPQITEAELKLHNGEHDGFPLRLAIDDIVLDIDTTEGRLLHRHQQPMHQPPQHQDQQHYQQPLVLFNPGQVLLLQPSCLLEFFNNWRKIPRHSPIGTGGATATDVFTLDVTLAGVDQLKGIATTISGPYYLTYGMFGVVTETDTFDSLSHPIFHPMSSLAECICHSTKFLQQHRSTCYYSLSTG